MIDYKALKGDPTDNIPGVPGVGEKTAAKLIREFGTLEALYERIDEVKPDKLRDKLVEHREAVFMGKDLSTIVRDLPVDFDLEAARLGDYDRETVIRLFREYEFRTLIERLPAMTGETAGDAAEALRGVATDGSVPAARVAGAARPSGWGSARPVRPPTEGGGLQLSLDFDAVSRGRAAAAGRGRTDRCRPRPRTPLRPAPAPPPARAGRPADARWPRRSPTRRGSRSTRAIGSRPSSRGSPPSRRSGSGSCSTTRARAAGRRSRSPSPASDGRTVAVEGPDDAADAPPAPRSARDPGRRARGQAAARRRGSATTRTRDPTPVAFDTQIAAYVLNAALRSQTIADVVAEQLDLILPPVAELDAAGPRRPRGALGAGRPRAARATAGARTASTACTARSSCR